MHLQSSIVNAATSDPVLVTYADLVLIWKVSKQVVPHRAPGSCRNQHKLIQHSAAGRLDCFSASFTMAGQSLADLLANPNLTSYETLYKHLHSHPELSLQEEQTASTIATHPALKPYSIHTSIGGHGLAGVLRNGAGPTVLLRADIDGLPILEQTGLPYASKARMKDSADDIEKPVMHACGHDMHITCMLAAAERLAQIKAAWRGTLIVLFQPNEERAAGAQAMGTSFRSGSFLIGAMA